MRSSHIPKTQGFWGRTRVRRIYLKRKGFGDERAFVAYTQNAQVLGTNARSSHILKRKGFGDECAFVPKLKTQGFWGRTRVRRIYLKRRGFGDERAFAAYT